MSGTLASEPLAAVRRDPPHRAVFVVPLAQQLTALSEVHTRATIGHSLDAVGLIKRDPLPAHALPRRELSALDEFFGTTGVQTRCRVELDTEITVSAVSGRDNLARDIPSQAAVVPAAGLADAAGDFQKGIEAPQEGNESEAAKWFRKAADQGVAKAQYNIGVMYVKGRGVLKDYAEAVKWYRKAAGQRHVDAQFNLGLIYGNSVLKDPVLAHMWWNIAASMGDKEAAKERDDLEKTMNAASIVKATQKARRCLKSNYKNCN